jgi:hypothetical protein
MRRGGTTRVEGGESDSEGDSEGGEGGEGGEGSEGAGNAGSEECRQRTRTRRREVATVEVKVEAVTAVVREKLVVTDVREETKPVEMEEPATEWRRRSGGDGGGARAAAVTSVASEAARPTAAIVVAI